MNNATSAVNTTKTGQRLLAPAFSSTPTLIPCFREGKFTGRAYKAELVLLRSTEGGARQHVWFEPDPRVHNHPWEFIDCKVLWGRYVAVEYRPNGSGGYDEVSVELRAGDPEHRLTHGSFHQVREVTPGTVSVMSFGPVVVDGKRWGHLVGSKEDGWQYEPNTMQPGFLDALRHLNPHMRPAADWLDPFSEYPVPTVQELVTGGGTL